MQPAACNLQLGSNNNNNNNNDDNNNNDILILIIIVTQVGSGHPSALPSRGCRKPIAFDIQNQRIQKPEAYIHHQLMPVTEIYLHTLCPLNSGTVMRLMLL